ncbi:MAG: sugar ABC transporter ATP-binding protein [Clostridia bacterium]|nr:sugar ABC transporter ATP-binding protein [Clostridia bacterium]
MYESVCRLKAENISKAFPGTKALTDVSIAVRPAEIHAIVGENGAGKSTLMNIVGGVLQQDSGDIYIDGRKMKPFRTPSEAQSVGIGFVHQELSLFPHLTIAQNIFVDRMPLTKSGLIDKRKLYDDAREILKVFSFAELDPNTRVSNLTIGNQQMIEIIRAVSLNAKLIIFDEPTSSLSVREARVLFNIIKMLKEKGISVIYISHRMSEIFEISDTVTILKDGHFVATLPTNETSVADVITLMVGREITQFYPPKSDNIGEEIFRVENFSDEKRFFDMSFSLKRGEVLGFYGLVGAGRSELMQAICGIRRKVSGKIYINGEYVQIRDYKSALLAGIAYLTEDRKATGLFPNQTVTKNIYVSSLCRDGGFWLRVKNEKQLAKADVEKHDIRTSSVEELIMNLSGGNQQKVLIARILRSDPKIIILDEPTRGIDVKSKAAIHEKVRGWANAGYGVIVISSEMPEIIGVSDRIVIMHEGRQTGSVTGGDINEQTIIKLSTDTATEEVEYA